MWYLILFGMFAAWVLFDGLSRKYGGAAVGWAFGTLFLGPLLVPVYLAKRPLKIGEFRIGGLGWNLLRYFAIVWTVYVIAGVIVVRAAVGSFPGMGFWAKVWFAPTFGAVLLGFLLKKKTVVENGPTGSL